MYPFQAEDFRSPEGTYRVRLSLEDPTARIHAFLYAEDGVRLFLPFILHAFWECLLSVHRVFRRMEIDVLVPYYLHYLDYLIFILREPERKLWMIGFLIKVLFTGEHSKSLDLWKESGERMREGNLGGEKERKKI